MNGFNFACLHILKRGGKVLAVKSSAVYHITNSCSFPVQYVGSEIKGQRRFRTFVKDVKA